jgi:murein DD-endopeptidase MepM/ murein hydrolase activator NlpD
MDTNKGKAPKKNGAVYVTVVLVLAILAILTAVFGSMKKSDDGLRRVTENAADTSMLDVPPTSAVDTEAPAGPAHTDIQTEAVTEANAADGEDISVVAEPDDELPMFVTPAGGVIMSCFSNTVPVFSITMNDYRTHSGVDISVGAGEAILAVADGVIDGVWDDPMMGSCLSIRHSGGAVSTYKNLAPDLPDGIAEGVTVSAGQVIAAAGESALAEIAQDSHVHYELSIDNVSVDPAKYINFSEKELDYGE